MAAYEDWAVGGERRNAHVAALPHATLAGRRELCSALDVTLDGMPAMITGARNRFATVAAIPPGGPAADYAWPAVARIVASGGGKFWT